jgi:hypothetical protein
MGSGDAITGAGRCPQACSRARKRRRRWGGMDGGGPGDEDCNDDRRDDRASLSPLSVGGEDVVSTLPGPDALKRQAQLLDANVVG